MILIDLKTRQPEEIRPPNVLRLAVKEAYHIGDPIPISITDAVAYLNEFNQRYRVFATMEDALRAHFNGGIYG